MQKVKLVSAEFYHFKGFVVSRIKHLKVTFTEVLQILNATNGAGKTTFIRELPPFSIDKDMFELDGYKRLVYAIGDKNYEIYSDHKTNHVIDLDSGENLSPGGTITVHNAIVESLFGVNQYQWAIAMGSLSFTRQDKNSRRKWIETISGVDFTYAFGVYDKLVKSISGTKQAVKIISGDLISAEERQATNETIEASKHEHAEITQLLNKLLEVTPRVANNSQELIDSMEMLKTKAVNTYTLIRRKHRRLSDLRGYTWNGIDDTISGYRDQINRLIGGENSILKVMDDESKLLAKIGNNSLTPEIIEDRLATIEKELSELRDETLRTRVSWLRCPKELSAARELYSELLDLPKVAEYLVGDALTGVLRPVSREEYHKHRSDLTVWVKERDMHQRYVEEYESHLKELASGSTVTCPKCTHLFRVGSNEVESITIKLDACLTEIAALEPLIDNASIIVKEYEWFNDCQLIIMGEFKKYLPSMARDIGDQLSVDISVVSILHDLTTYSKHVSAIVKGLELTEEKAQYLAAKATYSELEELLGYKTIDEFLERNEADIANIRLEKAAIEARLHELVQAKALAMEVSDLYGEYFNIQTALNDTYRRLVVVINADLGATYTNRLQSALGARSMVINEHEGNARLINSLADMVKKQESKLKAYMDIHKALNPTTGIIAEQVTGYCAQFSEQVTKVIDSVWGYPMTILPPKVERKGLDYQFPVKFENGQSNDVAKTSKSQTAVIDLAVSLCTRAALGLTHLPMFLDEVSNGLDKHHSVTIREFVKGVIKGGECSTVFFVDHEVSTRHQLGDYEEIVFNANQVITSAGYNSHVEIVYY